MRIRSGSLADAVCVGALLIATFVVHDVGSLLAHPYWLDETWVADSIRAPAAKLPLVTSSTPLGWTILLRIMPGSGSGQTGRLLPLFFSALAAGAGYALGEALALRRHLSGLLVGASVLISPVLLVRNDLKQYSAEAFATVALLALAARLENGWTLRRFGVFCAAATLGFLLAATSVFVVAALVAGLATEAAWRRDWSRAGWTLLGGALTGLASGAEYLLTVAPNVNSALRNYWDGYYLPTHPRQLLADSFGRFRALAPLMGFGHIYVLIPLLVVGLAVLVVTGRWAIAGALPATVAINIAAAAHRSYPFGDARTSTYWTIMVPVVMAVGICGLAVMGGRWHASVPLGTFAAALAVWVAATVPYMRVTTFPPGDVRDQVLFVSRHMRPGDVLVVNYLASFGLAFYDPGLAPTYVETTSLATGFVPIFPREPWIIQLHARTATAVDAALAAADRRLAAAAGGPAARIWIVRTQQTTAEVSEWNRLLASRSVEVLRVGPEPLLLVGGR